MRTPYTYPNSDLDRVDAMVAALGSFWSRIYSAKDQLNSYAQATSLLAAQNYQNLLETVAALSRHTIPIFHRQYWQPIVLRRSALARGQVVNNFFDANGERFDLTRASFNGVNRGELFYFTAPTKLAGVRQIFNQMLAPTVALTENLDYVVDQKANALVFVKNPFDNPGFLQKQIRVAGDVDDEIVLWGFNADFDYELVFNQFAYALGVRLKSSETYKEFVNAIVDAFLNGGASSQDIDIVLATVCGIPIVAHSVETVEVVDYDNYGLFIGTDKSIYRFSALAEPIVVPGQQVFAGAQLIDGLTIDELFVGSADSTAAGTDDPLCCPAPDLRLSDENRTPLLTEADQELILNPNQPACRTPQALTMLALDNSFLAACFYGDLVFENKDLPLTVDTNHPSGYTFVKFSVSGIPGDVDNFFDELHRRGVEAAMAGDPDCPPGQKRYTLAHYLDKRPNPISEPGPEHLPSTINPMRFIVENILRNNAFLVKIKAAALGPNRLGLYNIRQVRKLLPPGTAMILVVELPARKQTIDAEQDLHEQVTLFLGAEPCADFATAAAESPDPRHTAFVKDNGVTVRLLSGTCQ